MYFFVSHRVCESLWKYTLLCTILKGGFRNLKVNKALNWYMWCSQNYPTIVLHINFRQSPENWTKYNAKQRKSFSGASDAFLDLLAGESILDVYHIAKILNSGFFMLLIVLWCYIGNVYSPNLFFLFTSAK